MVIYRLFVSQAYVVITKTLTMSAAFIVLYALTLEI